MGRKKKKTSKPWCWYCNREFEDEKILLQHQKAKHFKCHICHKKLYTGPGLQIHCMQVHKESIDRVPNAIKGRDDITLEICGMENIPEEDLVEHEKQKAQQSGQGKDEYLDSDSEDSQPPPPPPPPPPPKVAPGPAPMQPPIPSPMMMGYPPHMMIPGYPPPMMGMMGMNPMMMFPMPGMQNVQNRPNIPNPSHSAQPHSATPQSNPQSVIMQKPPHGQKPPPLMSLNPQPLMATQAQKVPLQSSIPPNIQSPIFPPVVPPPLMQIPPPPPPPKIPQAVEPPKIEILPPGSILVHPEYDISLEEYRASLPKYKSQSQNGNKY
ncbi:BUB3-interacting and GLEBS motif-containing ZNF207-like protein [Brachionus plicatilis]|uniref:BUB3-interacting and GLEBS motif-containing ZNF207-like protein n=1 Tax=Brachionus plicatilis TaxID=10195 RepID=A0A3M7S9S2_BRAPC|nr:BUB3-interacting and GLEBS motif-containing ZNF207-like protein [Brachionus plicatilis]